MRAQAPQQNCSRHALYGRPERAWACFQLGLRRLWRDCSVTRSNWHAPRHERRLHISDHVRSLAAGSVVAQNVAGIYGIPDVIEPQDIGTQVQATAEQCLALLAAVPPNGALRLPLSTLQQRPTPWRL